MDNTPNHSIKPECFPINSWQKCEIVSWLYDNISFDKNSVKGELLQLATCVKDNTDAFNK